jgi:uncharacterized membrane protein YdcZ (DUF606 family)
MEPEVIRGLALAAIVYGFGTIAAALAAGGVVPMIALGLILSALSMDLFRLAGSPGEERDRGRMVP